MRYAVEQALYDAQTALDGLLRNLPMRPLAWVLRVLAMPLGHNISAPADKLASRVADDMMKNEGMLERLSKACLCRITKKKPSASCPLPTPP